MFNNIECPLGCGNIDTIQNVLTCPVLNNNMSCKSITESMVQYEDIFSENIVKQIQITHMYVKPMNMREKLMMNQPV